MKGMTKREKNLGVVVLTVCLLGGWWYLDRNLGKQADFAASEVVATQEHIRQMQASLTALETTLQSLKGPAAGSSGPTIPFAISTMAVLTDLTLPPESGNVRVVSVTRADAATFNLMVEGNFGAMMRFLSYLEREKSRFSVGNVSLGKMGDVVGTAAGTAGSRRQIRANLSIVMKG